MPRPVPDEPQPPSAVDHYGAALQAGCDALVTLQLMSQSPGTSAALGYDQDRIARAIKLLRIAIEELRLAPTDSRNAPLAAFVLETQGPDTAVG